MMVKVRTFKLIAENLTREWGTITIHYLHSGLQIGDLYASDEAEPLKYTILFLFCFCFYGHSNNAWTSCTLECRSRGPQVQENIPSISLTQKEGCKLFLHISKTSQLYFSSTINNWDWLLCVVGVLRMVEIRHFSPIANQWGMNVIFLTSI